MVQHYLESAANGLIRFAAPKFLLTTTEGIVLPTARLIPHLLSVSRPVLALVITWLLAIEANPGWAFLVLALAALTDKLDGSFARWFGCASSFGQSFDSICDKIMLAIVMFSLQPLVWGTVFWALLCLEGALMVLLVGRLVRGWRAGGWGQAKLQTNDYGRYKVGVEYLALVTLLGFGPSGMLVANVFFCLACVLASFSLAGKLLK